LLGPWDLRLLGRHDEDCLFYRVTVVKSKWLFFVRRRRRINAETYRMGKEKA